MKELVSIIVPVYNAEKTLDRCLSALIGQTYQNIEIILVNDGSKDRSLEICSRYEAEDSRIRVVDKPNGGVSSARNAGLDVARGEFVLFCDSDDWVEPDWCEELVFHYEENCMVMCGWYAEGDQNALPREVRPTGGAARYPRKAFYQLKKSGMKVPWNKVFSSAVIRENHIRFDHKLTNGEDFLFVLEYLTCITGQILFLDRCVYHYEWPSDSSLSKKVPHDYLEQCCFLSNRVLTIAQALEVDSQADKIAMMTDFFDEYQKIVLAIMSNKKLTQTEKITQVTEVMSSKEYQRYAAVAKISPNPIYTWLSRRKNGVGLWAWHMLRGG